MSWLVFRTCFAPVYDFRRKAECISSGMLDTEQTMRVFKFMLKLLKEKENSHELLGSRYLRHV